MKIHMVRIPEADFPIVTLISLSLTSLQLLIRIQIYFRLLALMIPTYSVPILCQNNLLRAAKQVNSFRKKIGSHLYAEIFGSTSDITDVFADFAEFNEKPPK